MRNAHHHHFTHFFRDFSLEMLICNDGNDQVYINNKKSVAKVIASRLERVSRIEVQWLAAFTVPVHEWERSLCVCVLICNTFAALFLIIIVVIVVGGNKLDYCLIIINNAITNNEIALNAILHLKFKIRIVCSRLAPYIPLPHLFLSFPYGARIGFNYKFTLCCACACRGQWEVVILHYARLWIFCSFYVLPSLLWASSVKVEVP